MDSLGYRQVPNLRPLYGNSIHPKKAVRTRIWHASLKGVREFGFAEAPDTDMFYNYTSHSRGSMPSILAPADSPSEEQFTLGNVAVELELEPRRANLLGADDVADGPDEADEQDERLRAGSTIGCLVWALLRRPPVEGGRQTIFHVSVATGFPNGL